MDFKRRLLIVGLGATLALPAGLTATTSWAPDHPRVSKPSPLFS